MTLLVIAPMCPCRLLVGLPPITTRQLQSQAEVGALLLAMAITRRVASDRCLDRIAIDIAERKYSVCLVTTGPVVDGECAVREQGSQCGFAVRR